MERSSGQKQKEEKCRRILQQYFDETGISEEIQKVHALRAAKYQGPSDITFNPHDEELYRQILEKGIENDVYVRLNIVGNCRQGKTSLAKRLIGDDVCAIESTIGIDVDRYRCVISESGRLSLARWKELENSDIIDRLASATITMTTENKMKPRSEKRKDNSSPSLVENVPTKRYKAPTHSSSHGHAEPFAADPVQQCLPKTELKTLVKQLNDEKKKRENNMILYMYDFAGQHVYYATHMLFHSQQAIYLLVFDLSLQMNDMVEDIEEDLCLSAGNQTVEECLRFWVNSIHSFVGNEEGTEPKIILVGTHKDKVKGDATYIEKYFSAIRDLFNGTDVVNHFVADDFAVNNLDPSDCSFDLLGEKIIEIGQNSTRFRTVPAKWIPLEKSLTEIRQNNSKKLVTLDSVINIDAHNEVPIADIEHIKLFLKYHHEKGTLFYSDEEPISNFVVLDPQYLIDAFKCIITSAKFCKRHMFLREFWQVLMKEAKLENQLITTLWGMGKENKFIEFKDELLAFLNKNHILSEALFFDEATQSARGLGWYVEPSLLRNHSSSSEIEEFMRGKRRTVIRFGMKFKYSSIVPTVYYRLVSAALGRWPVANFRDKYLLYKDLSVLRLDKLHCGILEMNNRLVELHIIGLCPSVEVNEKIIDSFRRFSESVVLFEFRNHRNMEKRKKLKKTYSTVYKCNHESHGISGSINCEEMCELQETELAYLPCPDNESHEISSKKAKHEWFQGSIMPMCNTNDPLTDKLLSKLACTIGTNWELLGNDLGLSQIAIEHIHEDHSGKTVMKIFHMLRKWQIETMNTATMNDFVQVLQRRRGVSVDWDEVRNIIEEENEQARHTLK